MCHLEYERDSWDPGFPYTIFQRKETQLLRLTKSNDIICLQEIHGKDEFLQTIQVVVPRFWQCGMSGDSDLVIVNVHFESDPTLRSLRDRQRQDRH